MTGHPLIGWPVPGAGQLQASKVSPDWCCCPRAARRPLPVLRGDRPSPRPGRTSGGRVDPLRHLGGDGSLAGRSACREERPASLAHVAIDLDRPRAVRVHEPHPIRSAAVGVQNRLARGGRAHLGAGGAGHDRGAARLARRLTVVRSGGARPGLSRGARPGAPCRQARRWRPSRHRGPLRSPNRPWCG